MVKCPASVQGTIQRKGAPASPVDAQSCRMSLREGLVLRSVGQHTIERSHQLRNLEGLRKVLACAHGKKTLDLVISRICADHHDRNVAGAWLRSHSGEDFS